jgi:hypothetical protein
MVNDGNSSRPALEHEIKDAMNFESCSSPDCRQELAAVGSMIQSQLDMSPDEAREQMQSFADVGIPVPATMAKPTATLTDSSFESEKTADCKVVTDHQFGLRLMPVLQWRQELPMEMTRKAESVCGSSVALRCEAIKLSSNMRKF